ADPQLHCAAGRHLRGSRRVLTDNQTRFHSVVGLLMDLDLQAQHVLQLVLRPGTFPIREIDQRHGLGSPAE
ncbi:Toxin-antitoxin system, antitoxin component, ribbon-helix-helix domain protein, partial [Dysosmobacter welbionis]